MAAPGRDLFEHAIAVRPADDGADRFVGHIPASWDTPGGVHGGMLVATALSAARTAMARDDLTMRSAHAVFLAPPGNDITFDVQVLREGRGSAHVRVSGRCMERDRPVVDATVMFTASSRYAEWLDAEMPSVEPPGDLNRDLDRKWPPQVERPPTPLLDRLDLRSIPGFVPWEREWSPDMPARYLRWGRYHDTPWISDGVVDPLSLLPLADLPTSAIWVRMPIEELPVFYLSLDLWITFLEPVTDDWVLADIRARWLGDGHAHLETDLWCADRLVAVSTQTMLHRRTGA